MQKYSLISIRTLGGAPAFYAVPDQKWPDGRMARGDAVRFESVSEAELWAAAAGVDLDCSRIA